MFGLSAILIDSADALFIARSSEISLSLGADYGAHLPTRNNNTVVIACHYGSVKMRSVLDFFR